MVHKYDLDYNITNYILLKYLAKIVCFIKVLSSTTKTTNLKNKYFIQQGNDR